jgi:hypothetical protein
MKGVVPGSKFPDYELTDHAPITVNLSLLERAVWPAKQGLQRIDPLTGPGQ